jgi:hypothetical protein
MPKKSCEELLWYCKESICRALELAEHPKFENAMRALIELSQHYCFIKIQGSQDMDSLRIMYVIQEFNVRSYKQMLIAEVCAGEPLGFIGNDWHPLDKDILA